MIHSSQKYLAFISFFTELISKLSFWKTSKQLSFEHSNTFRNWNSYALLCQVRLKLNCTCSYKLAMKISILIHKLGFFIVHTIINLAKFCQSILGIYNRILKIAFKAFIRPRSDWKTFFRGRRCCSICFDTHGHNREKFSWICGVAKIFSTIQFWNKQINIQENYTQTKVIKI